MNSDKLYWQLLLMSDPLSDLHTNLQEGLSTKYKTNYLAYDSEKSKKLRELVLELTKTFDNVRLVAYEFSKNKL